MPDYSGMTDNERLFVAGLMSNWDDAIVARDREAAIEVLTRVGIPPRQGAATVDTTLAHPENYGFSAHEVRRVRNERRVVQMGEARPRLPCNTPPMDIDERWDELEPSTQE